MEKETQVHEKKASEQLTKSKGRSAAFVHVFMDKDGANFCVNDLCQINAINYDEIASRQYIYQQTMLGVANFCIHKMKYPEYNPFPFIELHARAFLRKYPLVFLPEYECYRALIPLVCNNPRYAKNNALLILNKIAAYVRDNGIEALSLFRPYDNEVAEGLLELNVDNTAFLKEYLLEMAEIIQNHDMLKDKKIYCSISLLNTRKEVEQ